MSTVIDTEKNVTEMIVDSNELYLPVRLDGVDFTFVKPGRYESGTGRAKVVRASQPGVRVQNSRGAVVVSLKSLLSVAPAIESDPILHAWAEDILKFENNKVIHEVELPKLKPEV